MKKNRYFVRMIRVMAMMLALFTGAGGAWCTLAGMLTAYAKGMEKPTLNAAVSDGVISIQAQSGDSAIQKIMVNGYEFDDVWNGTLNIRLQQFDASYPEFTIQARPPPPAEHGGPEVPADDHPDDGTACMMFSHKESASAQILCTGTFWFFVTSYAVRCFLSAPGALPAAPVSGHG